ncbi:hypothetical protein SK128_002060 [Halocaridina rubra]|uniref:Uncharacterized protein n=1 Tax=Halocaridina rubra TaxID=373956 RepID=A0AAN8XIT8_HALRR
MFLLSIFLTLHTSGGHGGHLFDKPWKPPKPDKPPQLLARPPSITAEQLESTIASLNSHAGSVVKSGGTGKFAWPPAVDIVASNSVEEEALPDSTNL